MFYQETAIGGRIEGETLSVGELSVADSLVEFVKDIDLLYHLRWHPHYFDNNLKKSMDTLSEIINYFNELKEIFGMESVSMESFYNDYVNNKE